MTPRIVLVSPVPTSWFPRLWAWMQEDPTANLDDFGPRTVGAFVAEMRRRAETERTWGVCVDGVPVGVIAYHQQNRIAGMFHGICFTEAVHGTGVAHAAVGQVLAQLWAEGVDQVAATFFADNTRVARFLARLGATPIGVRTAATLRGGVPMDMPVVLFTAPARLRKAG